MRQLLTKQRMRKMPKMRLMKKKWMEMLRAEQDENDVGSGDDIWEDERIPDPLSSDDNEDEEELIRRDHQDPDELLALRKKYNSIEDFKICGYEVFSKNPIQHHVIQIAINEEWC